MADKSFGVKDINLIGASGTPEIESPNNLNIKAVNVAISTDMSVGGELTVADKIIHTGDTNTAIRFPATDTVTVETNGSESLRITSTGQLQATGAADVRLTLGSSGTAGTNDSVHIRADSANLSFMNGNGGITRFESNGTETLRITSAGTAIFKKGLAEKVNVKTQFTNAADCAITDGNVILTTSAEPVANTYPNITGVHSILSSGEGFSVTVVMKTDGTGKINNFYIDGAAQTIEWSGGSQPSSGSSGYDVYTFTAIKTGSGTSDYTVLGASANYD